MSGEAPTLKDFSGAAAGYFSGIRTPATLIVASTLGALFIFSKSSFSSENHGKKLFLARLYTALILAAFSLSFTTMIISTVAAVTMLHGRFDPMAETGYILLRREFDFEFILTRWAFIMSLLCFLFGITVRASLEFDLLRKEKKYHAISLILVVISMVAQILSYLNTTLYCWKSLIGMTLFVFQMLIDKCTKEENPLQIISATAACLAFAFAILFLVQNSDDDVHDHAGDDKKKN